MRTFTITEEVIQKAHDYIPLATKIALAQVGAKSCIARVQIGKKDESEMQTLPDRFQEDALTKSRFLMGVFAVYYLNIPFDGWEEDIAIPLDIYDNYCASHVFNQMERLKSSTSVRNKVFDILADFKEFTKMLNSEIFTLLGHKNDICGRLLDMIYSQTTPESLKKAQEEMASLRGSFPETPEQNEEGVMADA